MRRGSPSEDRANWGFRSCRFPATLTMKSRIEVPHFSENAGGASCGMAGSALSMGIVKMELAVVVETPPPTSYCSHLIRVGFVRFCRARVQFSSRLFWNSPFVALPHSDDPSGCRVLSGNRQPGTGLVSDEFSRARREF